MSRSNLIGESSRLGAAPQFGADLSREASGATMLVFKISSTAEWRMAEAAGRYDGAAVDLKDGFIHLSTADQVVETASKHFAGQADLLLIAFDAEALGEALKWEPSRGGALFPHLFRSLDPAEAAWSAPLPLGADGAHLFPAGAGISAP